MESSMPFGTKMCMNPICPDQIDAFAFYVYVLYKSWCKTSVFDNVHSRIPTTKRNLEY